MQYCWTPLLYSCILVVALCLVSLTEAGIIAKSTKNECVNYGGEADLKKKGGNPCKQKLVIALTVTADEGKSQHLEANVARVLDATSKKVKNLQLKQPVRIRIRKSPVLINYRLYQVGYVNNRPYELAVNKKGGSCRSDWYAHDHEAACGFAYDPEGKRIFDSQGFCCNCHMRDIHFDRGEIKGCLGRTHNSIAHCLKFDHLHYYAFALYPPQLIFKITIDIEQQVYETTEGSDVWEHVSTLEIGPQKRVVRSQDYEVKAEYIADFHPSDFVQTGKLAHKFLLIPDLNSVNQAGREEAANWEQTARESGLWDSIHNASEWLVINKHYFDFSGSSCNKIGVYYSAFRNQDSRCTNRYGFCVYNQPYHLWRHDKRLQREGRKGKFMLHNFGRVHSLPHSSGTTNYQLNFIAGKPRRSLITVSMVADDLQIVVNRSPGRIIEAYIDAFEALSTTGLLTVIVQNTGSITATYQVFVVHCSAGIDLVPSDMLTLDPRVSANISFTIHSFHAVGKINHCEVELYNQNAERLDNMTIHFETLDTCFCYGYCGCACGNGTADCPPPPTYQNETRADVDLEWLRNAFDFLNGHAGKFVLGSWFMMMLMCLGSCKVLHMLLTGQIDYPALTQPWKLALACLQKVCGKWCPMIFDQCGDCCQRHCLCVCAACVTTVTGEKAYTAQARDTKPGWRRPQTCDGMCSGAKQARRAHRQRMRINKRKGIKTETAWFEKPYTCTCQVRDTKPLLDICKGLFFFIYCPLLPLWWILDFAWEFVRRKWWRHKRKKRFRARRAVRRAQKEKTYLMLDQYTRGKVERQIVDFDKEIKAGRQKKPKKAKEESNYDLEEGESSSESSTDTTDIDEVGDIEELVNPGYPVYFNYACSSSEKTPSSLVNPGQSFSIKGRLKEEDGSYIFDLHECTAQVRQVVSEDKVTPLQPTKKLTAAQFVQNVDRNIALQLVTLTPLFTCLNDTPKSK